MGAVHIPLQSSPWSIALAPSIIAAPVFLLITRPITTESLARESSARSSLLRGLSILGGSRKSSS